MFQIGDTVVYGTTGVCRVADITPPPMRGLGSDRPYYLLRPLYQAGSIYTPVDNPRVKIRPLLTRQEAESLIAWLPGIQAREAPEGEVSWAEYCQRSFAGGECAELAGIIVCLYAKKQSMARQRRKFSQVEDRLLKKAQSLFHGELAAALGLTPGEVENYIFQRLEGTRAQ